MELEFLESFSSLSLIGLLAWAFTCLEPFQYIARILLLLALGSTCIFVLFVGHTATLASTGGLEGLLSLVPLNLLFLTACFKGY